MSEQNLMTSWMWPVDGGLRGLHIDTDKGILQWYDSYECLCADDGAFVEQTVGQFLEDGIPGGVPFMPDDVRAEMMTTVKALQAR